MRTLQEMESDLDHIEQNLKTVSQIASLARPYTQFDLDVYNGLIPTTAERITTTQQNLTDAISAIGGYAKELGLDVRFCRRHYDDVKVELVRLLAVAQTLDDYTKVIQNQTARFNAYQKQVLERVGVTK